MDAEHSGGGAHGERAIDVPGLVMRVRRSRDLSQRDLAAVLGVAPSRVSRLESASARVDLSLPAEILALADMRIAILDRTGADVVPVPHDVLRDHAERRMPAHLDVRTRADRPRSTLLHGHADRVDPPAWFHHRTARDRRRLEHGLTRETVPDQPTRGDAARFDRDRRAARALEMRQRTPRLGLECECVDDCFERGACAASCTCRCEP